MPQIIYGAVQGEVRKEVVARGVEHAWSLQEAAGVAVENSGPRNSCHCSKIVMHMICSSCYLSSSCPSIVAVY